MTKITALASKATAGRPAESATAATAVAFLLTRYFGGVDSDQALTAWGVIIAAVPAGVTWLVNTGRSVGWLSAPTALPPEMRSLVGDVAETARSALAKARSGNEWKGEADAITAIAGALERFQSMRMGQEAPPEELPAAATAPTG